MRGWLRCQPGYVWRALRLLGVGDGIRTRDVQIHSLALYQLSYTHRTEVLNQE